MSKQELEQRREQLKKKFSQGSVNLMDFLTIMSGQSEAVVMQVLHPSPIPNAPKRYK